MREVTLGGDRLGSGSKFKVGLRGFERSTHDLSYTWKTTMSAGTLVPFMFETGLPGDTFDIELDCNIKTHPTIGPLFDTYKVQLDVFKCDWRLYQGKLHNNKLRVGLKMDEITMPVMRLYAFKSTNAAEDINTSQINPSCLLSYMDIRGVVYVDATSASTAYFVDFNATKLLAYWDTYKNYYANKQELVGAVIHNIRPAIVTFDSLTGHVPPAYSPVTIPLEPAAPSAIGMGPGSLLRLNYTTLPPNPETVMILVDGEFVNVMKYFAYPSVTATYVQLVYNGPSNGITIEQWRYIKSSDVILAPPNVQTFALDDIDDMREAILAHSVNNSPFMVNDVSLTPYDFLLPQTTLAPPTTDYDLPYSLNQEGLAIKTYQSDLFNNWLRTEDIIGPDSISELTAIDTTGGLTMDQLNLQQKVYNMLSRVVATGNSYDDYINAVYAHESHSKPEIPIYCGGLSKELVFQEVISNAETPDQPLGTLAGRGIMNHKHKGGKMHIKCDEFCTIMGIISITPRIVYSQGNKWDNYVQSLADLHKPDLDGIGYQSLPSNQLAWWDSQIIGGVGPDHRIVGFQPAWVHYMTNVNRAYGNFAIPNNEMFMTLNRRYEQDVSLFDISDLTTYIDPAKFNHIFAQTSLDAMNFWAQVGVNIIARRKMSAKQIPNL